MEKIKLSNLQEIRDLYPDKKQGKGKARCREQYKVHLASWNREKQPLDVFVRSRKEWKDEWNSWSSKDDFSREYIFSLIDFYHESDTWLFGGIFRVIEREKEKESGKCNYTVELTNQLAPMIGRLKISWKRNTETRNIRNKAIYFEEYNEEFEVSEILKEPYTGARFPGYENICHGFEELGAIFSKDRLDWKSALENVKGVYLIIDRSNGKKYVGSAYGDIGIWSRWSDYLIDEKSKGHGGNEGLKEVIEKQEKKEKGKGIKYMRKNFRFSLLEHMPMKTDDKKILEREKYWKDVLLSQGKFGYNMN